MFRVVRLSKKLYGYEIHDLEEDEIADIKIFINDGTPVILAENLSDIEDMVGEEVLLVPPE